MSTDATLSQNEIDRLLGGSAGGLPDLSTTGRTSTGAINDADVQLYDFRRPHRISKDRLRAIEAMYERMVKNLEGFLLSRLRGQVELRLQSVEQFSFGEFTLSLPSPCASFVADINGRGGQQGVIDFGLEFAYFLVDRLFGGGGAPTILPRPLTPLERNAARIVADRIAQVVSEVWQEVTALELDISGFESAPEILQACAREDPVLVANVEVSASGISSLVMICLPFAVLEDYFTTADTRRVAGAIRSEAEMAIQRRNAEDSLRTATVSVSARLPTFRMSMRDLATLDAGALINTGVAQSAPLSIRVADQPRFTAHAGRAGRRLAARVGDTKLPESLPIGSIVSEDIT
jgi:flagellar motor switch protein FliM